MRRRDFISGSRVAARGALAAAGDAGRRLAEQRVRRKDTATSCVLIGYARPHAVTWAGTYEIKDATAADRKRQRNRGL
jgi:hypothetical protein